MNRSGSGVHGHNNSPRHSERFHRDRARQHDYRDYDNRIPVRQGRSPYGRNRHYDNRNRSPSYSERSPRKQIRVHDRRERTPSLTDSETRTSLDPCDTSAEKSVQKEDSKQSQQVNGATEELLSMEEDMDICDTPPHVPEAETSGLVNFTSSFLETANELVSPSEAPGNLLADVGETSKQLGEERLVFSADPDSKDLRIDERVKALFDGFSSNQGRELDTVAEVLQLTLVHGELQTWGYSEGFPSHRSEVQDNDRLIKGEDISKEVGDKPPAGPAHADKDGSHESRDSCDWFSGRWSCKGGDWKRIDESAQDRLLKKKFVLNDGYALCQMPKSGHEDPRRHQTLQKDDLYHSSYSRRLDLPSWAFNPSDESTESWTSQSKILGGRGVKGLMLPVVRRNACVVKDHGSFV